METMWEPSIWHRLLLFHGHTSGCLVLSWQPFLRNHVFKQCKAVKNVKILFFSYIFYHLKSVQEKVSDGLCVAEPTSAEVLLIGSETQCTANGLAGLWAPVHAWKHLCELRLAWLDDWGLGYRIRQRRLLSLLFGNIDDSALGQTEVATKVVDTLHPSFTGII